MSAHAASAGIEPSIARGIFVQARPIFIGQLVMLYGVVDTVLTGHASATDLAAMGLGAGVYSSVFVSLLGAINALNPIIAQHHGGRRHGAIGASYVQGLWLALLLSIAGGLFLAFPEPWLAWIQAPPAVDALVSRYLRVLGLALPASLMFRAIAAFAPTARRAGAYARPPGTEAVGPRLPAAFPCRIVVTDRLHGHILSLLLGIPHVLLDNSNERSSASTTCGRRRATSCSGRTRRTTWPTKWRGCDEGALDRRRPSQLQSSGRPLIRADGCSPRSATRVGTMSNAERTPPSPAATPGART